jgi:hypothetical protein
MATASQVSRVLNSAGMTRSEAKKSRIKGLREYSAGFKTEQYVPGTVQVQYWPSSLSHSNRYIETKKWAEKYATVLTAHGYKCEVRTFGAAWVVRVTK